MISSLGKYSNWQVRLDQSVQLVLVLRCAVERTQAGVTVVVFIRELLLQLQSQSSLGRQLRFDGGGGGRLAVRLGRHQRLEVRGDAGGGGAGGAGAGLVWPDGVDLVGQQGAAGGGRGVLLAGQLQAQL